MLLYRVILPDTKWECEAGELYYRADGDTGIRDGALELAPGAEAAFDTYYNGFFYSKYVEYCGLEIITVSVRVTGRVMAELVRADAGGGEELIESREISDAEEAFEPVRLDGFPVGGMVFCRLRAVEKSRVTGISFSSDPMPQSRVRLAAVICTYHREEYVRRNIRRIWQYVREGSPIFRELEILVIDNGNTLEPFNGKGISIIPNRNLGGSGGFTRGLMEALDRGDRYSHVLLMDDDISFEPEVLVRTVQLLKCLRRRERPVCIGGQMLIEDEPCVQYESGGLFKGERLHSIGRGLELTDREALFQNEREDRCDYNAWWYCCMPLELVRRIGLPMPLFIKCDDVEYGLRSGAEFVRMNGIGVWHRSFASKQSPHLEYYVKRNELIVSALYGRSDGVVKSLYKLFRSLGGSILRGETAGIRYIEKAYEDFLKTPEFLARTDGESLNKELARSEDNNMPHAAAVILSAWILLKMAFKYATGYGKTRKALREGKRELTDERFWRERLLNIGKESENGKEI